MAPATKPDITVKSGPSSPPMTEVPSAATVRGQLVAGRTRSNSIRPRQVSTRVGFIGAVESPATTRVSPARRRMSYEMRAPPAQLSAEESPDGGRLTEQHDVVPAQQLDREPPERVAEGSRRLGPDHRRWSHPQGVAQGAAIPGHRRTP